MHYKELIEKVALYGYGTFTLTMMPDAAERASLTKFIQRNSHLFTQFKGKQGDLKIIAINNKGKKHFGLDVRLSEAQTWQSFIDMALFNAYMAETGDWSKQTNRPHFLLELNEGKIGLISSRWGINKKFMEAKLLLATENQKLKLVKDHDFIATSAKELKTSPEKIHQLIINSYTPLAFRHIRNA